MRALIPLGEGTYTVSEVCRILQPSMTPRKVHYWLDTGLLSESVRAGSPGIPTLLSFRQLLEIRTVQHLREELEFSLQRVREAVSWILEKLFADDWTDVHFLRGTDGNLVARTWEGEMVVPGGQGVLPGTLKDLNAGLQKTRRAWEARSFEVARFPRVVADARVMGGTPTVRGSRVETSALAAHLEGETYSSGDVDDLSDIYRQLDPEGIIEALRFEGRRPAA